MVTSKEEMKEVLSLFKSGKSKAEIGREIGRDKKQVGIILAKAIKEVASEHDRPDGNA